MWDLDSTIEVYEVERKANLFDHSPHNIFSTGGNCKGAKISVILSTAYLYILWVDNTRSSHCFSSIGNGC
jgi:hypothetical protein